MQIFEVILFFKLRTIQQKTVKATYLCPLDARKLAEGKGDETRVFSPVKTSVEEYLEILVCAHSFNFSFDDNWVRLCSVLSESIIFSFVFPTLSSRILSSHHRTQSVCCIMSVTIVYNLSNPCSIISKPANLVFIMSAPAVGSIDKV